MPKAAASLGLVDRGRSEALRRVAAVLRRIERVHDSDGLYSKAAACSPVGSTNRRPRTMNAGHVEALRNRHDEADSRLHDEMGRPAPDPMLCADLKKRKLSLKDAVVREQAGRS
jgi:hypothetical protein